MSSTGGLIFIKQKLSTLRSSFDSRGTRSAGAKRQGKPAIQSLLEEQEQSLLRVSRRLELALEASAVGVWEFHPRTGNLIWDNRMREIFEIPDERRDLGYSDFRSAVHPDDISSVEESLTASLENRHRLLGDFRIVLASGRIRHLRAYGIVHTLDDGERVIIGANWDVSRDVELQQELSEQNTALEAVRKELEHQALHDALTGLPNRRYMDRFIAGIQARTLAEKTPVACLHVDLDRFKEVNDTLGHAVGDAVLQAVSKTLKDLAKNACFLARIGGDEFVLFVAVVDAEKIARTLASHIVEVFSKPIKVDGRECRIGASVGLAIQAHGCDVAKLITDADIALYEAKKNGRGKVRMFAPALRSDIVSNRQLADQILKGIEGDEFLPFFQLQFDARTLAVSGAEALARWRHPELGLVAPNVFLPIAEEIGKLGAIDEIILEKSLGYLHRWNCESFVMPRISVNVSAQRIRDEAFFTKLEALDFQAGTVAFELLESISFDGRDSSLASAIEAIKNIGIDVEIDDFGTGHASIVSLLELSPNRLKIDRKLTHNVETIASQRRLVSAIVDIARALGIETIAEGVENMRQAEVLRDLGCNVLQGYALAKPVAGESVRGLLLPRYDGLPGTDQAVDIHRRRSVAA